MKKTTSFLEQYKHLSFGILGTYIYMLSLMVSKAGMNIGLGFMFLGFIFKVVKKEKIKLEKEEIFILIVLILTPIFSLLSPGGFESFKIAFQKNYRYLGIFLIPLFIINKNILKNNLFCIFISFFINFAKAFTYFKATGYDIYARYTSFGGNTLNESHMNAMLIMLAFSLIIYSFKNKNFKYKIGSLILFLFIFVALLEGQGRGAWLGVIISMFITWFLIAKNKKKFFISVFAVFILSFTLLKIPTIRNIYLVQRFTSIQNTNSDSSNKIRLLMWEGSFNMFKSHPVFGVGRDNSGDFYLEYFKNNNKYNELPEHSRPALKEIGGTGNSHSMYFTSLAEQGLLIIGFIGMFLYVFYNQIKFLLDLKKFSFNYCIVLGTMGMLVAFCIGGLTENSWQEIWKSSMICGAIGMYLGIKKNHIESEDK